MGSELYLKDFLRPRVLNNRSRSRRPTRINEEKVDEINDFFQTQVFGLSQKSHRYHK